MKVERKFPEYLKRANGGGLLVGFIYVLVFMSILFLWIWQTFETENDKLLLNTIDEIHVRHHFSASRKRGVTWCDKLKN